MSVFAFGGGPAAVTRTEMYLDNSNDLLEDSISRAIRSVTWDGTIVPSLKNRNIIRVLYRQGIFNMKNSVDYVAERLNISKNTVYMHLRYIKGEKK